MGFAICDVCGRISWCSLEGARPDDTWCQCFNEPNGYFKAIYETRSKEEVIEYMSYMANLFRDMSMRYLQREDGCIVGCGVGPTPYLFDHFKQAKRHGYRELNKSFISTGSISDDQRPVARCGFCGCENVDCIGEPERHEVDTMLSGDYWYEYQDFHCPQCGMMFTANEHSRFNPYYWDLQHGRPILDKQEYPKRSRI